MVGSERGRDEWLEPDGLGGFASGTVRGIRTRRYHALLLTATTPPSGRVVLVNGCEAWLETPGGPCALTSQRYAPDVIQPDGAQRIEAFEPDPWPSWVFALPGGGQIEHALVVQAGRSVITLSWRLRGAAGGTLAVRPLLSGRDYHALHHENPAFRFDAATDGDRVVWRPIPASRRSLRARTATTPTSRSGIATSSTARSAIAGSTTSRTWRRPASSAGTWRMARRC